MTPKSKSQYHLLSILTELYAFCEELQVIRNEKFLYKFAVGDNSAKIGMAFEEKYRIGKFGSGERLENGSRLSGHLSPHAFYMGTRAYEEATSLVDMGTAHRTHDPCQTRAHTFQLMVPTGS
ncbi:unnamed protein product [Heligmosomoides polygyrus]|uniref:Uncharacterized protein n=1 Tax=Heligmosomoides polygyrus TaxID=6339 RepID=A0A183FTL8_HELPZ|nr:unnamed protein product [Heligmosomoides polygyrus]